jgi:hypothetical protein
VQVLRKERYRYEKFIPERHRRYQINNEMKGTSEIKSERRKETEMSEENITNLTQDVEIKGTIKFNNTI